MASNKYDNTSQRQDNRLDFFKLFRPFFTFIFRYILSGLRSLMFDGSNRQRSIVNQQKPTGKDISRILEDIIGDPKGFQLISGSEWSKTKRIPRFYYINNAKTILLILQGDITKTKVDAIVNAANEHMTGGSGVDGIIHDAAGDELYNACKAHKEIYKGVRLPTGHSRILLSYNMWRTTHYIINTAGPMYKRNAPDKCAEQLSSCYKTALALASLYDLESIAFTAISCGIFGYPADDGAKVALQTVDKEADSVPVVVFVLWDNHIYDAWIKKAEELKFTVYDPQSSSTAEPSKPLVDDDEKKKVQNPMVNDSEQGSSSTLNLHVTDLSTQSETDKTSKGKVETLANRLPSVPSDSSDTQPTESMEHDHKSANDNPQLTSQNTADRVDVGVKKEGSTTDDNPPQQPTHGETNESNNEKAKTGTTRIEPLHSNTTNNSDDPNNQKAD